MAIFAQGLKFWLLAGAAVAGIAGAVIYTNISAPDVDSSAQSKSGQVLATPAADRDVSDAPASEDDDTLQLEVSPEMTEQAVEIPIVEDIAASAPSPDLQTQTTQPPTVSNETIAPSVSDQTAISDQQDQAPVELSIASISEDVAPQAQPEPQNDVTQDAQPIEEPSGGVTENEEPSAEVTELDAGNAQPVPDPVEPLETAKSPDVPETSEQPSVIAVESSLQPTLQPTLQPSEAVAPVVVPDEAPETTMLTEEPTVFVAVEQAPELAEQLTAPIFSTPQDTAVALQPSIAAPQIFSATTLTLQTVTGPDAAPNLDALTARFDIVRVDSTGATLVAGQAEPNAVINIISAGEIVAETRASAGGEFVAFLSAPMEQPADIVLKPGVNQTEGVVSQAQVIILPMQNDAQNEAPIVVLATQDSVQVIQPSGLSLPDNISLDTISYNEEGNVVLAGRGTPNRMVRIYADGAPIGASSISESGSWGLSLAGLEAGRYVLRVDEITPDGQVASRIETPFQREFPEALALSKFSQGAKVIVQPGNTLWLMATQAYGNGDYYTQIFSANEDAIRDPDLIYPGQVVSIPNIEE